MFLSSRIIQAKRKIWGKKSRELAANSLLVTYGEDVAEWYDRIEAPFPALTRRPSISPLSLMAGNSGRNHFQIPTPAFSFRPAVPHRVRSTSRSCRIGAIRHTATASGQRCWRIKTFLWTPTTAAFARLIA